MKAVETVSPKATMKEEDIRPAALMREKQGCVEWDKEFLLAAKDQWVVVTCPACTSSDHKPFGEKDGFPYVECNSCGTVYTNPRPSQSLIHEFYKQSKNYEFWNRVIYPSTEEQRLSSIIVPRVERVLRYCAGTDLARGTLLEVGAAFGSFCLEVRKRGAFSRVLALEPTPDLAASCRKRGLETLEMPIEVVQDSEIADVIVAFEVLEHLFSPRTFVEQCARIVRRNGILILTCPNVRGFDAATLKMHSGTFDHEHMNYFHPESLPLLLGECGFETIDVVTPGRLDAELVRKKVLEGRFDLSAQPFLQRVLVDDWERLGEPFQAFLAGNRLSSHMWVVARRTGERAAVGQSGSMRGES